MATTARALPDPVAAVEGAWLGDATHSWQMMVHGLGAAAAGMFMALGGAAASPSFDLVRGLYGWPWLYGSLLSLSGLALVGCRIRGGRPRLGVWALGLITIWYLLFAGSFFATWGQWFLTVVRDAPALWDYRGLLLGWHWVSDLHGWWFTVVADAPSGYPTFVYGTLAVLTGTHVWLLALRGRRGLGGHCHVEGQRPDGRC